MALKLETNTKIKNIHTDEIREIVKMEFLDGWFDDVVVSNLVYILDDGSRINETYIANYWQIIG